MEGLLLFFFFLETLNKVDTIWRRRNFWAKSGHLWHSGTWGFLPVHFLKATPASWQTQP